MGPVTIERLKGKETDAWPEVNCIKMDGQPIALRPSGLADHEWQAVCLKLTGRTCPLAVAIPDMGEGWHNMKEILDGTELVRSTSEARKERRYIG